MANLSVIEAKLALAVTDLHDTVVDYDFVIWKKRKAGDYKVVAVSRRFHSLDADADSKLFQNLATRSGALLLDLASSERTAHSMTERSIPLGFYRYDWRSGYLRSFRQDDALICGIFTSKHVATGSSEFQIFCATVYELLNRLIASLVEIDEFDDAKRRITKSLLRLSAAEAATRHLHDIKDIMNQMEDPVHDIEERGKVHEDRRITNQVQVLRSHVDRAKDISSDFLRAIREQRIDRKPLDLLELIVSMMTPMQIEARGRGVKLTSPVPGSGRMVLEVDPYRFSTVLNNVVSNAIYFARDYRLNNGAPEVDVTIGASADRRHIIVKVIDNGPGIDDPEKAFEVGFSTRPAGTGMGLSISRAIMREHRGEITIENLAAGGTCVALVLPLDGYHTSVIWGNE